MSETQLATIPQDSSLFANAENFELAQRQAKMLSASALVPKEFQGANNLPNCVIALEMSQRMQASPLAVMQNLYIVHGKPSWSSQFIIAAVNATGKFSPLRFVLTGEGDDKTCIAWAEEKETKERLESPPISIGMAKAEGWYQKKGSKWQTMPELMLRYRTATLFGRLYAPEVLMGMKTYEEAEDIGEAKANAIEVPVDAPRVAVIPGQDATKEEEEPSEPTTASDLTPFQSVMLELDRIGWNPQQAEALAAAEGVVDDEEKKLPTYTETELAGLLGALNDR
jgi:hypothetical protein